MALGRGQRSVGVWGSRRDVGWLVLATLGGGRLGNVACAPGNAPIALAQRPARSVWSLLALMETDSRGWAGAGAPCGPRAAGAGYPRTQGTRERTFSILRWSTPKDSEFSPEDDRLLELGSESPQRRSKKGLDKGDLCAASAVIRSRPLTLPAQWGRMLCSLSWTPTGGLRAVGWF